MNVLAIYAANEMLQSERQRAYDRLFIKSLITGPSLRDRIASALAGLRRIVGSPVHAAGISPKLQDYPYRG